MRSFNLKGVICAMVTPMDRHGDVDFAATAELIRFLIGHGVDGLFIGGTTGEGPLLSLDERMRLAECAIETAEGKAVTIVHTGCQNTRDAVQLTRHAAAIGVDATAAITPYFYTYSDEEIATHYLSLAQVAPDVPLLIYCFPGSAKNDVTPKVFARVCEEAPNIVGIKYSGNCFVRVVDYIEAGGENGFVYTGEDRFLLASLVMGGSGFVSGCAAVFPEPYQRLYRAFLDGRLEEARTLQELVRYLAAAVDYGQVAHLKAALDLRGLHGGHVRAPLRPLSQSERRQLGLRLRELDLL